MRLDVLRSHAWQVSLGRFVLLVAAAALVGIAIDAPLESLALALFGYSVWSLASLHRLQSWLRSRRRTPPPEDWGVWSDVSEFVYRRYARARSQKRRLIALLRAFREAAAALPDGVVVLSPARGVVWFNESAGRLLGLAAPRDHGALIDPYLPDAALAWLREGCAEPLLDVASLRDPAVRLSFRHIPYSREQSLLVVRDMSHIARLEQVRRDFVANVSHELRTPLTVLHGYLDLLEPDDAPQWAPMLRDLRSQTQRMARLVEDLLTLSRLEGAPELPDERVPMHATCAALAREAEGLSQGRHAIATTIECDADLRGSPQYLHSAFSNLVSNAVRYTPDGGSVAIAWRRRGDGAELVVDDTGHGIPAEHLPRITERFYRVSASRSRATGGTGLGLAIVKHVLGLHGARLEIESEPGRGSRFACVFDAQRLIAPLDHGPDAPA